MRTPAPPVEAQNDRGWAQARVPALQWSLCLAQGLPAPVGTHVSHDEFLEGVPSSGGVFLPKAQVDLVLRHELPVAQVLPHLCKTPNLSAPISHTRAAPAPLPEGSSISRDLRCMYSCVSSSL